MKRLLLIPRISLLLLTIFQCVSTHAESVCFTPERLTNIHEFSAGFSFTVFDERMYFARTGDDLEDELWSTDGSASGTELVPMPAGVIANRPVGATEEYLFFYATVGETLESNELFRTDGTLEGTIQLFRLGDAESFETVFGPGLGNFDRPATANGTFFFEVNPNQLWRSDGSFDGTYMLADFTPVFEFFVQSPLVTAPNTLTAVDGGIVFVGAEEETGVELWYSDGSISNTRLLKNLFPEDLAQGSNLILKSGVPYLFTKNDGHVNFDTFGIPNDSENPELNALSGVWRTDGTDTGTFILNEVRSSAVVRMQNGHEFVLQDYALYRLMENGNGIELITEHENLQRVNGPNSLVGFGDNLLAYFGIADAPEFQSALYVYDQSQDTSREIIVDSFNLSTFEDLYRPPQIVASSSHIYFFAETEEYGGELWVSDGTRRGTKMLVDTNPGPEDGAYAGGFFGISNEIWYNDGQIYFHATDGDSHALWTVRTPGGADESAHTADLNQDYILDLTELLRLIQFFNSDGFHVQAGTEDGYAPGPGSTDGEPHDSDYLNQDWQIELSELLRAIQLYNAPVCNYCVMEGTEDGFAV